MAGLLTRNISRPIIGGMTKDEAIKELGGTQEALAKRLGIQQSSVSLWETYPPRLRQLQIEALTGGKLKAEPDCVPAVPVEVAAEGARDAV